MFRTRPWPAALLLAIVGCGPQPQTSEAGQRGVEAAAGSHSSKPSMQQVTEQIDSAKSQAGALVAEFAGHLQSKRFAEAYALMSPLYRSAVTVGEFERVVDAQPHLAQMTGLKCFEFRGSPGSWFRYDRCTLEYAGVKAFAVVYFEVSASGSLAISSMTIAGLPAVPVPGASGPG